MAPAILPAQRHGGVTPNGLDMATTWNNVRGGQSGIGPITLFDTSNYEVKIAGEVYDWDPLTYMSRKEARRADRFAQFAMVAADEAVEHAGGYRHEHEHPGRERHMTRSADQHASRIPRRAALHLAIGLF